MNVIITVNLKLIDFDQWTHVDDIVSLTLITLPIENALENSLAHNHDFHWWYY